MKQEMNDNHAKIRITETEIEISGPADFVERQVDKNIDLLKVFGELIKMRNSVNSNLTIGNNIAAKTNSHLLKTHTEENDFAEFEEVNNSRNVFEKYSSVIGVDNEKIHILCAIPGGSLTKRMINLILIYMYAKLQFKIDRIYFSELRDVCEMHGELDSPNFAKRIKENKRFFLIEGDGKSQSIKLSIPGIREAESIIISLQK